MEADKPSNMNTSKSRKGNSLIINYLVLSSPIIIHFDDMPTSSFHYELIVTQLILSVLLSITEETGKSNKFIRYHNITQHAYSVM